MSGGGEVAGVWFGPDDLADAQERYGDWQDRCRHREDPDGYCRKCGYDMREERP